MGAPGTKITTPTNEFEELPSISVVEDEKLGVDYNVELPVIKLNGKVFTVTSTPKHKSFFKRG